MSEPLPIRDTTKADAVYALACELLPALRAVARSNGYALAYHGSFARDIDLIAAPWLDRAIDARELAEAIRLEAERVTGHPAVILNDDTAKPLDYTRRTPEPKPHGRLGWSIHLAGCGTYLDLSVLAAGQAHTDTKIAELERKLDDAYAQIVRLSKRAPVDILHIRQEDPAGCVCASLAMATSRSYTEVRAHRCFRGVDWTVGITHQSAEQYLALTGFASGLVYRWLPGTIDGKQPQLEPWPPQPFAPVHIISINGGRHDVVWLPDGTVLDPMQDAPRRIEDVGEISYVMGIFKVSA